MADELITIEELALGYLSGTLEVPVYMEVPENCPSSFVVMEKTGSRRENRVNHATIAVQSYAETLYGAAALNERVKEAMDGLGALHQIGSAKLNSDYNFTDTATKKYRYQAVYDITHY